MSAYRKAPKSDVLTGIDFGTTKVCVVIGRPAADGDGLEILGVGRQPSLGIRKGVVVNIPHTVDAVCKAVAAAEKMAGVPIGPAFVGIAGGHIQGFNSSGVVAVKGGEVTDADVERSVEAAKAIAIPLDREVLHVIPQEFVVNDQEGVRDPVGMAGVRLESKVHIVTGAVASAQNIVKCATLANVECADIVLEPLASAEACLTDDEKELGVVLVDFGGGTTDISMFLRGSVVHTAVVSLGGTHVTNDIAVGLRCAIRDAEAAKVSGGAAMATLVPGHVGDVTPDDRMLDVPAIGQIRKPREISRAMITKIIEPRVEEILQLVEREIAKSGFKHLMSTGVVVTGGASMLEGLPELAEFVLEMPVRRGAPRGLKGHTDLVAAPGFSTAVGLLLYGLRHQAEARFRGRRADEAAGFGVAIHRFRHWLSDLF